MSGGDVCMNITERIDNPFESRFRRVFYLLLAVIITTILSFVILLIKYSTTIVVNGRGKLLPDGFEAIVVRSPMSAPVRELKYFDLQEALST